MSDMAQPMKSDVNAAYRSGTFFWEYEQGDSQRRRIVGQWEECVPLPDDLVEWFVSLGEPVNGS
jgi:hypothetical protein